jgi:hypothetical protein
MGMGNNLGNTHYGQRRRINSIGRGGRKRRPNVMPSYKADVTLVKKREKMTVTKRKAGWREPAQDRQAPFTTQLNVIGS